MGPPFFPIKTQPKNLQTVGFSAPFKHMAPFFTSHIFLQEAGGETMEDFLMGDAKMHSSPIWLVVAWIPFF